MEHWLSAKLFLRLTRQLELTEAGQRYLVETGALLDRLSQVSLPLRDERGVRVLRVNATAVYLRVRYIFQLVIVSRITIFCPQQAF